jgi:hypothetical protein
VAKTTAVLIALALFAGLAIGAVTIGPRFEVYSEQQETSETSGGVSVYWVHDKSSGIELICVARSRFTEAGISCVPSGRNWK